MFAAGTRFAKERLWHVEITFAQPVEGPLIIGDGRYLGLGLMEPVVGQHVFIFRLPIEPAVAVSDRSALLSAVRRALMSLSPHSDGSVPRLFSGHETDGAPAQSGRHEHVFLAAADLDGDGCIDRLIVAAPWVCDPSARSGSGDQVLFDRVVGSLATVRAGRLGVVPLQTSPDEVRFTGPAPYWESHTEYRPTRYPRRGEEPITTLVRDVFAECDRRGLPRPEPQVLTLTAGPRGGVAARVGLRFAVAVKGPIMLGRDSHRGGGLFLAAT